MKERLSSMRRSLMWTQARLAAEAGVSPTTVSGIESGRISHPHFGTVGKLAHALGVAPRELLVPPASVSEEASPATLSLEWARESPEVEFEREIMDAPLDRLKYLRRELDEERERLQALYGESPQGTEQRRFIKRRIRAVSAQSVSVSTSIVFDRQTDDGQ